MFYIIKEVDVIMLKKGLLITFLVLLILPIVLGQNEDFRPRQPPVIIEKDIPEIRQRQDLDIEGVLTTGSRYGFPKAYDFESDFMAKYDKFVGALLGITIHNDEEKYFSALMGPETGSANLGPTSKEWFLEALVIGLILIQQDYM